MPATFAHCLMAKKAIDKISNLVKADQKWNELIDYVQKIGEKNNFAMMGAAGPDYPYTTDILTTVVLQISHTWANRMHYESTLSFIQEGVRSLAKMDKSQEAFSIRLAWFCGFVSHVLADSYMHPVINSIVHGTYIFTHEEHGKCELIQDAYIFQKLTGEEIVAANPRTGNLGYLRILDECSDPSDHDKNRIHSEIYKFWKDLLEKAHPHATEYFSDIDPDRWHHNYKGTVNFVVDPGAIFRHVVGLTGRDYKKWEDIPSGDREKYVEKISLPNGKKSSYDDVFKKAVDMIVDIWLKLFEDVSKGNEKRVAEYIKDWNLDTGVDESRVDLWEKEEA